MKKQSILTIVALALSSAMSGQTLSITTSGGGTVGTEIGDNKSITELTIAGEVNAVDFDYIANELGELTKLDLSQVKVVATSGTKTSSGNSEFKADELPAYALFGSNISTIVLPEGITKIGEAALGNTRLTEISIPASVTKIGNYAFTKCEGLKEITIPATVGEIGAGVVKDCTTLTKLNIAAPITALPDEMAKGCAALSEVTLPPTVTSIGNGSFANCGALRAIGFPATLLEIGDKAFYNSGLTAVQLGNSGALASVGDFAFAECKHLESAAMGSSGTTLGKGIFFGDTSLQQVQLPQTTTVIPAFTFKGTNAIDATTALPSSTSEIGDYALYGWEQVENYSFPDEIGYIGTGAMEGWTALKKIEAENLATVPTLGEQVWAGINQREVYLYVTSEKYEEFKEAEQWRDFKVTIGSTDATEIIDDATGANGNVDFIIGDGYLTVETQGEEITDIRIYDLNGRSRYSAAEIGSTTAIVGTAQWRGSTLIVDVTLANGSHATIKLSI